MPEQKQLTIDGVPVLWKLYRQRKAKDDLLKLCIGPVKPEKEWSTAKLSHDIVNACTTTAALSQAVRRVASELMGNSQVGDREPSLECCSRCQPSPAPPLTS